jgi:hypothetical protein
MAVEAVESGDRGTRRLGHPKPVADRGAGMTHQHAVGARADMLAEQLGVAGKSAIGDNDGLGADVELVAAAARLDSDATTALDSQGAGARAEKHPSLPLLEPAAQFSTLADDSLIDAYH